MDFFNSLPSLFSFQKTTLSATETKSIEKDFVEIRNKIAQIGQDSQPMEIKIAQDMNRAWNETMMHLSQAQSKVLDESGKEQTSN